MFEPRLQVDALSKRAQKTNQLVPQAPIASKRWLQHYKENFVQYLLNTTLHGLKYIGDRTITRFERLFFTAMFLLVMFLSVYFISNVWNKWNASPIIITQSPVSTSVKDIPFPAVTICNMNQVQKSAVLNTARGSEEYSVVKSICRNSVDEDVKNSVAGKWTIYRQVLLNVSQPCEEMLVSCQYGGLQFECRKMFTSILTDGGLCCIFNGLHPKFMMKLEYNRSDDFNDSVFMEEMANDWSPETGFQSKSLKLNKDSYPRPGVGSGSRLGLSLILNVAMNEYYCSSTSGFGFKVVLHAPHELPQIDEYGVGVSNGYESRIVATPMISGASNAVRKIPMHVRQCVYQSENFLTFYRVYSRENCESECVTQVYLAECNCILYYMPRLKPNVSICGLSNSECISHVQRELLSGTNDSFKCQCFYGCDAIKFDMGFSATTIFQNAPILKEKNLTASNTAILHVFHQRGYYRGQNKEELIGFTEFLSSAGGLLGLFMGFSVFSVVEVLYFLSIRPYCEYMKSAKRRRESLQRVFRRFNHNKIRSNRKLDADSKNLDSNLDPITSKPSFNSHSATDNIIFPHVN